VIQGANDSIQPVEEIFQRKGIRYAREVVTEYGDIKHRQKAGQHGFETVKRARGFLSHFVKLSL
jgi:hypothetical protein